MTIKFDHNSPPSYVRVSEFTTGVMGYWVSVGNDEKKLSDGDYITQDDNGVITVYTSSAQYVSDLVASSRIREDVGKELIRNIWSALKASAFPGAQMIVIADTIAVGMVLIDGGFIVEARGYFNAKTTNGNFTAGVKTALLALMDTAIAKL